jgi:hypothetical protein
MRNSRLAPGRVNVIQYSACLAQTETSCAKNNSRAAPGRNLLFGALGQCAFPVHDIFALRNGFGRPRTSQLNIC